MPKYEVSFRTDGKYEVEAATMDEALAKTESGLRQMPCDSFRNLCDYPVAYRVQEIARQEPETEEG